MMSFFVCLSFCRLSFVLGYVVIITTLVLRVSAAANNLRLRLGSDPEGYALGVAGALLSETARTAVASQPL
jgi:hypothetical protein